MKVGHTLMLAVFSGLAAAPAAQAQFSVVAGMPGSFIPGVDSIANLLPGSQGDDASVPITLPAAYGSAVLPAGLYYADSNGRLTTDAVSEYINAPLVPGSPAGLYPHWDDLFTADYAESGIYAVDTGTMYIIQWNADPFDWGVSGYPAAHPTGNARFQIQINPAGSTVIARFVYNGMGSMTGQSATVGAVSASGQVYEHGFETPGSVGDAVVLSVVEAVIGGCCLPDATCAMKTAALCLAQGGAYRGDNTSCVSACSTGPGEYAFGGGPVPISDGEGTGLCGMIAAAEIVVPDSFTITGVDAGIRIAHPVQGDVRARLVHGATSITLLDRPGAARNPPFGFGEVNFGAPGDPMRFGGGGTQVYNNPPLAAGISNVSGHWLPASGTMTAFQGQNAQGVWRLEVEDCAAGDTGSIEVFHLVLGGAGGGCYANCDASTQAPALNVADYTCFLQRFAAGDSYANCDLSTQAPTLNVADFTCFLQRFAAGCP